MNQRDLKKSKMLIDFNSSKKAMPYLNEAITLRTM